jgi:hypothetical protein
MKARSRTLFTAPLGSIGLGRSKLRRSITAPPIVGILAAVLFARVALAVEVTEPQGIAHAYPALLDANGKKLADGEFRQWIEDDRLRIKITYDFNDGQYFEENAVLRQKPELIQEKWSWKESKNGKVLRQFSADFPAKTASALTYENNKPKERSEKIEVEPGRTFAGFGFTLALQNLRKRLINGGKNRAQGGWLYTETPACQGSAFIWRARPGEDVRTLPEGRSLRDSSADSTDRQVIYSCAGHTNLADQSSACRFSALGRTDRRTK